MDLRRYSRQILFKPLGEAGQKMLLQSRVTLIGCGALGSMSASLLARAGVGFLRIVDRDFVELDNLQRQHLFDETDVKSNLPKAVAAAQKLKTINSEVTVEPVVADVTSGNIEGLLTGLVVDGTDNFEARLLINDACIKAGLPWVYGGAVGAHGMVMPILPGKSGCFRCFVENVPEPGQVQTCDTAGILNVASSIVGGLQAGEAVKILIGAEVEPMLTTVDVWEGRYNRFNVGRNPDCVCCARRKFEYLDNHESSLAVRLCGRGAVQVSPPRGRTVNLEALAGKLAGVAAVQRNAFLMRFEIDGLKVTVFPDARAIISGTEDETRARTIYARYVGT
jgi:adenylyltransferase/sulfurtransferase